MEILNEYMKTVVIKKDTSRLQYYYDCENIEEANQIIEYLKTQDFIYSHYVSNKYYGTKRIIGLYWGLLSNKIYFFIAPYDDEEEIESLYPYAQKLDINIKHKFVTK